jgi:hypothetical protein
MSFPSRVLLVGPVILVLVHSFAGCANVRPRTTYSAIGSADPAREREIVDGYAKQPVTSEVNVFIDSLPPGVTVANGEIQIDPNYQHRLIGRFTMAGGHGKGLSALRRFPNYRAGWKKGYCYPQTVLTYMTLFIWSLLPPAYPCYGSATVAKEHLVGDMKALASAAGGNLVVAGYTEASDTDAAGATGFILVLDPRTRGQAAGTVQVAPPPAAPAPAEQPAGDQQGGEQQGEAQQGDAPAEGGAPGVAVPGVAVPGVVVPGAQVNVRVRSNTRVVVTGKASTNVVVKRKVAAPPPKKKPAPAIPVRKR